jgi:hypothetical protein
MAKGASEILQFKSDQLAPPEDGQTYLGTDDLVHAMGRAAHISALRNCGVDKLGGCKFDVKILPDNPDATDHVIDYQITFSCPRRLKNCIGIVHQEYDTAAEALHGKPQESAAIRPAS